MDEINACIKRSVLWRHIDKLYMTENMRAQSGTSEFCRILLELPNPLCQVVIEIEELIREIYE
ncbi:hypothetical protein PR048_005201 [Dryococelus australis]|uniref:Uncharacterized protein n=1 Tax=Dryococelus australis TaxID=614101 RepID=A0ABQ9I7H7_9NEOP|nr:hypothetical protein PR048_005201 [Dryococelus australis]